MIRSASRRFVSTQPVRAVRSPSQIASKSSPKKRCSWQTLQISGRPGSVRKMRFVSVTIDITCFRIASGSAKISMTLPSDFDILLTPSVPLTIGESVKTASGSGKTWPYRALNVRRISRASSK
jgi:hypothetical protein